MISIQKLNIKDKNFYELYDKAYSWDKDNYCFKSKGSPEFLGLFSEYFALYENDTFIGYGILNLDFSISSSIRVNLDGLPSKEEVTKKLQTPQKINIAYIINPLYRNLGYGTKLLSQLIRKAEERTHFDLMEVSILKKNLASISLIEKQDFDFKYFDEEKIVFQKAIKK